MARILIIDDDPDFAEATKEVLISKEHEVVIATTGSEGFKKIKQGKIDLVILDVMMETGDRGFDVAREIKNDAKYKDIPILMLTAIREKTGLDFSNEAGDSVWLPVDAYCEKPLKPEELIKKIETLLKQK